MFVLPSEAIVDIIEYQPARVDGGTTSLVIDDAALATATGLSLTVNNSTAAAAPGFEVGFEVLGSTDYVFNGHAYIPDHPLEEPGFGKLIHHSGSLGFDPIGGGDTLYFGNFILSYDNNRSEFYNDYFLRSTFHNDLILFDIDAGGADVDEEDPLAWGPDEIVFEMPAPNISTADLMIAPEFATWLLNEGLVTTDTTGMRVGDLQVMATSVTVPEPAAFGVLTASAVGFLACVARRRRRA